MTKKVIIFGGDGFIGSAVTKKLLENGDAVMAVDNRYRRAPFLNENKRTIDALDIPKIIASIDEFEPDAILNFAAMASIEECNINPIKAIRANIISCASILDAIHDYSVVYSRTPTPNVPLFFHASSVYVNSHQGGIYGITKRACEDVVKWYANKYDIPYIICRYGTIYGPGAGDDNSIQKMILHALQTKMVSYYGTGEEVREYIHIRDVAEITKTLIEDKTKWNNTYTITGLNPTKAHDLVIMIKEILGDEYKTEFRHEDHPQHYSVTPYRLQPDVAVKYIPETIYDLGAGLLDTIQNIKEE